MAACVLCLDSCQNAESYKIFSEAGFRLNISKILDKHFWLELTHSAGGDEQICHECWDCVSSFNTFYQRVYNIHQERRGDVKDVPIEFCGEAENPLELAADMHDMLAEDLLATGDVKVESNVTTLEPLEELTSSSTTRRSSKRLAAIADAVEPKRRIKSELVTIPSEGESDGERPLSEFVVKPKPTTSTTVAPAKGARRRGRPPKNPPKSPHRSPPRNLKAEVQSDEDKDNDGKEDLLPAMDLYTEDSESSSGESSDSLPDVEPEERYAVIPKRVVNKPKKYRKRPRPLVPPVRMSREELQRKQAQQDEYDVIIKDFFKKLPCHICNLLVINFGDMRRHLRMSHNIDNGFIICCGRKFHVRKGLAEHVLVHKNPEHFMCAQCGRVFQDSKTLETHELTHTDAHVPRSKPTFPCEKCTKTFTTKAALEYHNLSKHVPKSDFKFTCTVCNKKVPTERRLKAHMQYMHDPETTIICDKCGKSISLKYLKKHRELKHSDESRPKPDPVQCDICGTWLRHMAGLKQHMSRVHEPPGTEHRCHICDKTSINERSLKRHIYYNHQCERKFQCTMCEKAFKRPHDLREHISTHTGEVLYTCPHCPQTCASNANMHKHRQRFHPAEFEAERQKRLRPNIMEKAVGATSAMKERQARNSLDLSIK